MSYSLFPDVFSNSYSALIGFVARRTDTWLRRAKRETRPSSRDKAAARAYLYTVADHIAIDPLRRAGRTAERCDASGDTGRARHRGRHALRGGRGR